MIVVYSYQVRDFRTPGNDIENIFFADSFNRDDCFNDPLSPWEIESFDSFDLIML